MARSNASRTACETHVHCFQLPSSYNLELTQHLPAHMMGYVMKEDRPLAICVVERLYTRLLAPPRPPLAALPVILSLPTPHHTHTHTPPHPSSIRPSIPSTLSLSSSVPPYPKPSLFRPAHPPSLYTTLHSLNCHPTPHHLVDNRHVRQLATDTRHRQSSAASARGLVGNAMVSPKSMWSVH